MPRPTIHNIGSKFNSTGNISSNTFNFSVDCPDNLQDGEDVFVVITVRVGGDTASVTPPSGFVEQANVQLSSNVNRPRIVCYRKRALDVSSEPTSYTFVLNNMDAGGFDSARIESYRVEGASDDPFTVGSNGNGSGDSTVSTLTVNSISSPEDNITRVAMFAGRGVSGNYAGQMQFQTTGFTVLSQVNINDNHPVLIGFDDVDTGPTGDVTVEPATTGEEGQQAGLYVLIGSGGETGVTLTLPSVL